MKDDAFNTLIGVSDDLNPGKACSFSIQQLMKNCVPCAFKTRNQEATVAD
jgi:hypothetical protein